MSINIDYAVTDNYVSKEEYEKFKKDTYEELENIRASTNKRIDETIEEFHCNLNKFDKFYTSILRKFFIGYVISTVIAYLLIVLNMCNVY